LQGLERRLLHGLAQRLALSRRCLRELPDQCVVVETELGHGRSFELVISAL
jgi:hypothetical protein